MKHYDYLVVGAGLFGSTFAAEATRRGKGCLVVDKRDHIGGNVYTQNIDGINVHKYGAHIFHTSDSEVWQFVNKFAQFNNFINSPIANYKGELYNMPFNMNTFYKMWGVRTPEEAERKINEQRIVLCGKAENLEQQALSLVGEDIYKKLIKGYTEKQWGSSCSSLPPFIIRRIPLRFTFDNNYFSDKYQGVAVGGYTAMIEKMLAGCDVLLQTDYFEQKTELDSAADRVIYTGCIDRYFDFCFGKLAYRSLRFESELLDKQSFQGVAVVNYTDFETPYTRIIEHKYFEGAKLDKTVITREYPAEWTEDSEPYYPVNNEENQHIYKKYAELAKNESKVVFGGRLGEYKYCNMDETVKSSLELSKKEF